MITYIVKSLKFEIINNEPFVRINICSLDSVVCPNLFDNIEATTIVTLTGFAEAQNLCSKESVLDMYDKYLMKYKSDYPFSVYTDYEGTITDQTLIAIAKVSNSTVKELVSITGLKATKLEIIKPKKTKQPHTKTLTIKGLKAFYTPNALNLVLNSNLNESIIKNFIDKIYDINSFTNSYHYKALFYAIDIIYANRTDIDKSVEDVTKQLNAVSDRIIQLKLSNSRYYENVYGRGATDEEKNNEKLLIKEQYKLYDTIPLSFGLVF